MTQRDEQLRDRTISAIQELQARLGVCVGKVVVWSIDADCEEDTDQIQRQLADELFEIAVKAQDASKAIIESQDQDNATSKA